MRSAYAFLALLLLACGAPQSQFTITLEASAPSGALPESVALDVTARAGRDVDESWGNSEIVPVLADWEISADGAPVITKVSSSEWVESLPTYPRVVDVVVSDEQGTHRMSLDLPDLIDVSLFPEHPTGDQVRVDWSPSGDAEASVGIELVHKDAGLVSWTNGEVDDGSETLEVGGPLNSVIVTHGKQRSEGGLGVSASLRVSVLARPPVSEGQSCDSDDDCSPLVCDWIAERCHEPEPSGGPCSVDEQCAGGICNWQTHQCGQSSDGTPCLRDEECLSALCLWQQNVCGAPLPSGSACIRDSECASLVCVDFTCA